VTEVEKTGGGGSEAGTHRDRVQRPGTRVRLRA
jgi:hypothetical protein